MDLTDTLANEDDEKTRIKIDKQLKHAKTQIIRLEGVVSSQSHSSKDQDALIKAGVEKYSKYQDRLYKIFDSHLDLMVAD
jgi:hypothetical protein